MRVLVIGEAIIDIVERADGTRSEHVGGSPANVAFGLARLGRDVDFHTRIALDARGNRIQRHLSGVRLTAPRVPGRSATAVAVIGADGSASYAFDIEWSVPPVAASADIVHSGSIALFVEPGGEQCLRALEAATGLVTIDPNIRPALVGDHSRSVAVFERATAASNLVKLSDEDARWLYPSLSVDEVITRVGSLGPATVVMTLGARGMRLQSGGNELSLPARPVEVVDTIGAGDSVMASLIDSLGQFGTASLSEHQLRAMAEQALAAAAITVARAGALPPTRAELDRSPAKYSGGAK